MRFSGGTVGVDEQPAPEARGQLRREQRLHVAMRGRWPELPRKDLTFGRFLIEHASGDLYTPIRGEVSEDSKNVAAYYIAASGEPVFLERPPGAKTRQALEEQRAERELRRQMPRARPRR